MLQITLPGLATVGGRCVCGQAKVNRGLDCVELGDPRGDGVLVGIDCEVQGEGRLRVDVTHRERSHPSGEDCVRTAL
jgi:hypothetical protein